MFYDDSIIQKVRALRSKGKTYSEIMKSINKVFPKSTISQWCRDIVLPLGYQYKIAKINKKNFNKAQKLAWLSNKNKRERLLANLLKENNSIVKKLSDKQTLKMILAVLYLGEGSKWKSHRGLMLGSASSEVIKLFIKLLNLCYGINSQNLKCRISYRADQDINKLRKYWSNITAIPFSNFYKTIPDPRTLGKPTKNKEYKGVCVISCGGTHIQLELEAIPKLILKGL